MKTILILTLAGSIMMIFYMLYAYIVGGTPRERRIWLTVTALFYLVPLRNLKEYYAWILHKLGDNKYSTGVYYNELSNFIEVHTEELMYQNKAFQLDTFIFTVWVTVAASILLFNLIRHFVRKHLLEIRCEAAGPEQLEVLERLKRSVGLRRKIRLVFFHNVSPMTTGFIRPVIILPEKMRDDIPEIVLKHELTHTKNGDMLVKVVLMLVTNIHWFNPFAYLLRMEYEKVCELMSDDRAVEGCSDKEKIRYIDMLLQESKAVSVGKGIWRHHLTREGKFLKERMDNIMQKKNRGKIRTCVGSVALIVALFVTSLTALAYEDVHDIGADDIIYNDVSGDKEVEFLFSVEDELEFSTVDTEEIIDIILYDVQFVDEDGNIYEGSLDGAPYFNCPHSFKSGTCTVHSKSSDGSCTVYYYKGQICEVCGDIVLGDMISSHYYVTCPH